MLARPARRAASDAEEADAASQRIRIVGSLEDLKPCHMVIEAIVENLDAKRQLFAELEGIVGPDCILATNTSSLSVTTIAAKLKTPQRFAGFHFFNPVPLMKLVEVIRGLQTEDWLSQALMTIGRRMTRDASAPDRRPGLSGEPGGPWFHARGRHLVHEGIASFADVDRVMREAAAFAWPLRADGAHRA